MDSQTPKVNSCGVGFGRYMSGVVYSCIACPPGSYNWLEKNTEICMPCPAGLNCPGGSTVRVTDGIWMPATSHSIEPEHYECPFPSTCCTNGTCPAGSCSASFSGVLCTECSEPSHYLWNGECTKCSSVGGASFYLILFGAFLGAVGLVFLPYEEAPTVEILFFYFQVTYYIFEGQGNGILSIPGLSTFLAVASLNVDGIVSDCTLPISGVSKMMFRFFLPLLILFYIIAIYFGTKFLQSSGLLSGESSGRFTPYYMKGQSLSLICFRATIVVLTFVVMPLIDGSLILLQCNDILGKHVLTTAPNIECFGSTHAPAAALAIIILILFLGGVPVLIGLILRYLAKGNNITYEEEGISNIQKLFQVLYIVFKPEMYWMMPVTMLEKGVTSILFTIIYWQPYNSHLEAYLNREITLGILVMIAFRQFTDQYGVSTSTLIQIGIVMVLPVLCHIVRWIRSNLDKHQNKISGVLNTALATAASTSSKFSESQSQIETKSPSLRARKVSSIEKLNGGGLRVRKQSGDRSAKSSTNTIGASNANIGKSNAELEPFNVTPAP
ncbi:hypothetical protein BDR26DRAFT_78922 [Obelidium mucronatum]|nr:hypothetical protein BDR26DRAFT_78922 [Obelidium mucronatum]